MKSSRKNSIHATTRHVNSQRIQTLTVTLVGLGIMLLGSRLVSAQAQSAQDEFETGKRFFDGAPGVQRDPVQGAAWYLKAAEQGYAPAEAAYADCLRDGTGVRKDGAASRSWYAKAAAQENTLAEAGYGYAFAQGIGGPVDLRQAFYWYSESRDPRSRLGANRSGQTSRGRQGRPQRSGSGKILV